MMARTRLRWDRLFKPSSAWCVPAVVSACRKPRFPAESLCYSAKFAFCASNHHHCQDLQHIHNHETATSIPTTVAAMIAGTAARLEATGNSSGVQKQTLLVPPGSAAHFCLCSINPEKVKTQKTTKSQMFSISGK